MSSNPTYFADDIIFDNMLLGTWTSEEDKLQLTFNKFDDKTYGVVNAKDEDSQARLVKIGKYRYIDFLPKTGTEGSHALMRINIEKDTIQLEGFSAQKFKTLNDEKDLGISFKQDMYTFYITSPTEKLRTFVLNYSEDLFLSNKELILQRKQ